MKKEIVVVVGHYNFYFDDVEDAVIFADTAKKHVEDGGKVYINIIYVDEEETNETE